MASDWVRAARLGRRLVLAQPLTDDSVDTTWTPLAMKEKRRQLAAPFISLTYLN